MKANPGKYQFLWSGNDSSKITIGNKTISRSILLGTEIDKSLNFKEYIESLCKNSSHKTYVLSRLASAMNFEQRRILL